MRRPGTITVVAPDGHAWTVGPRWRAGRGLRLPTPWRDALDARNARRRAEKSRGWRVGKGPREKRRFRPLDWLEGGIELLDPLMLFVLALVLVCLLLFFVAWPLLAIAVELVFALALLAAGLLGRFVFARPWTVEARREDGEMQTWAVRGYRAMRAAVRDIAEDLGAGAEPRAPEAITS